jgi:hypothetical protein
MSISAGSHEHRVPHRRSAGLDRALRAGVLLLEQGDEERWVFRRHGAVTRPLDQVGMVSLAGVPFERPEIALLFKAKRPRFKDERDFDQVLPRLDAAARAWLASALGVVHPSHAWCARL